MTSNAPRPEGIKLSDLIPSLRVRSFSARPTAFGS
jgi:hypothetical protein